MKKIYLILFKTISISNIFCLFCGQNPPQNKNYCGNYLELNSTHRCCYCKHNETGNHYCLLMIFNKDDPNFNNYTNLSYKGYTDCDCDNIREDDDLPGAPCRNHAYTKDHPEEINKEYCHRQSIDDKHPCCYYHEGDVQKCFGIGKITSDSLYTYNDFLDCFSKYFKFNIFIFIFFLFLLI